MLGWVTDLEWMMGHLVEHKLLIVHFHHILTPAALVPYSRAIFAVSEVSPLLSKDSLGLAVQLIRLSESRLL